MTNRLLPLAFAALLLTAGHLAAQPVNEDLLIKEGKRMSAAEIQQAHAGMTVHHENLKSGQKFVIWFAADGTRSFRAGNRQFTGEWGVKNDQRCEETIAGPVVCMTFYKKNEDMYACDPREAPECRWIIRRTVPGDTEVLGKK